MFLISTHVFISYNLGCQVYSIIPAVRFLCQIMHLVSFVCSLWFLSLINKHDWFGVVPIGCGGSVFVFACCALLCALSSFAIILKKRELVALLLLSNGCLVCYTVLCVLSSFAILSRGKRDLVALLLLF